MSLQAVIFDLDGVITDTAEYHYLAWQQLADEEGLSFSRDANEQLRGVSRRASLELILGERQVPEAAMLEMMTRKNNYYIDYLDRVTPNDLLDGVIALLDDLDAAGIPYALGSASKNAKSVLDKLDIAARFAYIADGHTPGDPKPAPDLFLYAADKLGIAPADCLVVEDAAAGIVAAQAAGMAALAIGDQERFGDLLDQPRTALRPDLAHVTLADLRALAGP